MRKEVLLIVCLIVFASIGFVSAGITNTSTVSVNSPIYGNGSANLNFTGSVILNITFVNDLRGVYRNCFKKILEFLFF